MTFYLQAFGGFFALCNAFRLYFRGNRLGKRGFSSGFTCCGACAAPPAHKPAPRRSRGATIGLCNSCGRAMQSGKSGERVSRPRRTRPAARGGRTSRDAVAGRPATLSPGGTPAAQAVRRAQSGVAFRPAGARRTGLSRAMPGAPRQRRARPCKLKPGDAPKYGARGRAHNASDGSAPPPAQEQGTQRAPPVSAPPSPPQT